MMKSKKSRYKERKVGGKTIWWDNECGGPIVGEPPAEEPEATETAPAKPKGKGKTVKTETPAAEEPEATETA